MGRFFLFLEENQWVRNMLFFGCGVFILQPSTSLQSSRINPKKTSTRVEKFFWIK